MKKSVLFFGICLLISGFFCGEKVINQSSKNSLLIENIEALADGEDISGYIDCAGNGSIYCPVNQKSEYKEVHIYQ